MQIWPAEPKAAARAASTNAAAESAGRRYVQLRHVHVGDFADRRPGVAMAARAQSWQRRVGN